MVIHYVDAMGNSVAPTAYLKVDQGADWSHASPQPGGFELADPNQGVVSGTGGGEVTVRYNAAKVSYKVQHLLQTQRGAYYVAQTDEGTADAGTSVSATPASFDGYRLVDDGLDFKVAADGNSVKSLHYDRVIETHTIFFTTKGSPVNAQEGPAGTAVTIPEDPKRPGYNFAGWDMDADGNADDLAARLPTIGNQDVAVTALWTPATNTGYTIRFLAESRSDVSGAEEHDGRWFRPVSVVAATGTTDSAAAAVAARDTNDKDDVLFGTQYLSQTNPSISADGSTVQDVFYESKVVEASFLIPDLTGHYNSSTIFKTERIKYHELTDGGRAFTKEDEEGARAARLALGAPQDETMIGWYNHYRKVRTPGVVTHVDAVNVEQDGTLSTINVAVFSSQKIYRYTAVHVNQRPDGSWPEEGEHGWRESPSLSASTTFRNTTTPTVDYQPSEYQTGVIQPDGSVRWNNNWKDIAPGRSFTISRTAETENAVLIRKILIPHDVQYFSNGRLVRTTRHVLGEEFSPSQDVDGSSLEAPLPGHVFAGWFADPTFKGEALGKVVDPGGKIAQAYYAKWLPPVVHVTFDSHGGDDIDPRELHVGDKVEEPAVHRDGFELLGWFFKNDAGDTVSWNFDQPLTRDVTLSALWKAPSSTGGYRVEHVTADGRVLATESHSGLSFDDSSYGAALGLDDPRREGLRYVSVASAAGRIGGDAGKNVIRLVYSNDRLHTYSVRHVDEDGNDLLPPDFFATPELVHDFAARKLAGYHLVGPGSAQATDEHPDVVIVYARDEQPVDPTPGHAAPPHVALAKGAPGNSGGTLPQTSDVSLPQGLIAQVGGLLSLAGAFLRRRRRDK